jgi:DNA integrity scanning protein DisA with diadenylate cyclase activity
MRAIAEVMRVLPTQTDQRVPSAALGLRHRSAGITRMQHCAIRVGSLELSRIARHMARLPIGQVA